MSKIYFKIMLNIFKLQVKNKFLHWLAHTKLNIDAKKYTLLKFIE